VAERELRGLSRAVAGLGWPQVGPVLVFPFFSSVSFSYFLFPVLLFELAKLI
jgi:hypothetical protein